MDTNKTFQVSSQSGAPTPAICEQFELTTATVERTQMVADAEEILRAFSEDYRRMAE